MKELFTPLLKQAFDQRTERGSACWIWKGAVDKNGYGLFRVQGKTTRVARFLWQVNNDRRLTSDEHVLHSCDNPCCVNPEHLHLGSHAQNMADMAAKGRANRPIGAANGRARLTPEQVLSIRAEAAAGVTQGVLSTRYGVSRGAIYHVLAGRTW